MSLILPGFSTCPLHCSCRVAEPGLTPHLFIVYTIMKTRRLYEQQLPLSHCRMHHVKGERSYVVLLPTTCIWNAWRLLGAWHSARCWP